MKKSAACKTGMGTLVFLLVFFSMVQVDSAEAQPLRGVICENANGQLVVRRACRGAQLTRYNADTVTGPQGIAGERGESGSDGQDGLSAYELAVKAGYSGSEAEWLESLRGQDGKNGTNGRPGADGQDGRDGAIGFSSMALAQM